MKGFDADLSFCDYHNNNNYNNNNTVRCFNDSQGHHEFWVRPVLHRVL